VNFTNDRSVLSFERTKHDDRSTEAKLHNNLVVSPQSGSTPRPDSHSICFTRSWIRHANDFIIQLNQTVTLKTAASSSSESTGNVIILHVIRGVITNVKIKVKVTLGRPWRQRVAVEVQLYRTELCVYYAFFCAANEGCNPAQLMLNYQTYLCCWY